MRKMIHAKTKYLDEPARILQRTYPADGSVALELLSTDGDPLAMATVCLIDYGMKPKTDHVFIKNYSENEGMYECLVKEGIVEPGERIVVGPFDSEVWHCPLSGSAAQAAE